MARDLNAWMFISMARNNPDTYNDSLYILNQLPTSQSWPIGRVWHYYTIGLGTVPAAAQTFSKKINYQDFNIYIILSIPVKNSL